MIREQVSSSLHDIYLTLELSKDRRRFCDAVNFPTPLEQLAVVTQWRNANSTQKLSCASSASTGGVTTSVLHLARPGISREHRCLCLPTTEIVFVPISQPPAKTKKVQYGPLNMLVSK